MSRAAPSPGPELTVTVDVPEPPEQVWRAAMDWIRQGEWMLATRVELIGGDGASVGSMLRAVTGVGRLAVADTFEIVEWDPPQRCVVRHTGRVVRGLGVFDVRPNGSGGSTFAWSERLELPFGALGRRGWPLARPAVHAGLAISLRRFARYCRAYP